MKRILEEVLEGAGLVLLLLFALFVLLLIGDAIGQLPDSAKEEAK